METYTRVYDSYAQAQRAVTDLEQAGIASSEISLVANKHISDQYADVNDVSGTATGAGVGAALGGGVGLLAGLGVMAIPGLGPVVAAGWLAATAVGAVAGSAAGGILGALTDAGTPEHHAHVYSEAVRRGGTLLTVKTNMPAAQVNAALDSHRPIDPELRRSEYEKTGWTQYDPAAPAYKPTQTEIDQIRRPYQ